MASSDEKLAIGRLLLLDEINRGEQYWIDWVDESNRSTPEVDCVVTFASGRRCAVEHTEAQGLPNFQQVYSQLEDLETRIRSIVGLEHELWIRVSPEQVQHLTRRAVLAVELGSEIKTRISSLPVTDGFVPMRLAGADLEIWNHGRSGAISVSALHSNPEAARVALDNSLGIAVAHKNAQLGKYRTSGATAILLVQVVALSAGQHSIREGIARHLSREFAASLDEIWVMPGRSTTGLRLFRAWP